LVNVPVTRAEAVGVNVMLIVQPAETARLAGPISVSRKSPAAAILEMESGASPEFERVIVCATLVVPTNCEEKLRVGAGKGHERSDSFLESMV